MQPVDKTSNRNFEGSPKKPTPEVLSVLFATTLAGTALFLGRGRIASSVRINPLSFLNRRLSVSGFSHLIPYVKLASLEGKVPEGSKGGFRVDEKTVKAFGLMAAIALPALAFYDQEKEPLPDGLALEPLLPDIPEDHPIREEVTAKIVGHEADFLIRGTSLEGSSLEDNAKHIHTFNQLSAKKEGISSKTAEKLEDFFEKLQNFPVNSNSVERREIAQGVADKVFSLKPGESFCMQGGWTEKLSDGRYTGHAMLYKFTKTEEGLYDVYIYNTGSGAKKHHDKLEVEEGTRKSTLICPYVKFQGVLPSQLGFSKEEAHPEFFERLIHIYQGLNRNEYKDSSIIYESRDGFGGLHDKLAIAGPNTSYIKPQRAGTCALSVLLAAVKSLFESEEEFKRFKFELKYTDFLLFFEKVKDSLAVDSENQELLEKQGRKLIDSLEKRLSLYPEEEIAIKEGLINRVLGYLALLPKVNLIIPEKIEPVLDQSKVLARAHYFTSIYDPSEKSHRVTTFSFLDKEILIDKVSPTNLLEYLEKINGSDCENTNVNIYAREQVGRALLKFSKQDFASIPKEKIKPLIIELKTSLKEYIKQSKAKDTQEYINTAWAYLSAAYTLTTLLVPSLEKHGLAYRQLMRSDRYNSCYSKEEQENLAQNITFFENQPSERRLFDFPGINQIDKASSYPPEVSFIQGLIDPRSHAHLNPEEAATLLTGQNFIWQEVERYYESRLSSRYIGMDIKKIPLGESAEKLYQKYKTSEEGRLIANLQEMAFLAQISCSNHLSGGKKDYNPAMVRGNRETLIETFPTGVDSDGNFRNPIDWECFGINDLSKECIGEYLLPALENVILTKRYGLYDAIPQIAMNQKDLQCSKLLYFFSENPMKLKDPIASQMFFRLFFQPNEDLKKDPFIFKALKDEAFIKQLSHFIEDGVNFFSNGFFSARPDIVASLFFARLVRRVKEIDSSLPLVGFQDRINDYLKIPGLSPEKRKLLHLHRILQYKGRDVQSLQTNELQEIFSSWIFCGQSSFSHKGDGINQKEEAFRFILSLTPTLENLSSKDYDKIVCSVLGKTQEEVDKECLFKTWIPLTFPTHQKGPWRVNVLTGELTENDKLVEFEDTKNLPNPRAHRDVFGNVNFPQVKEGKSYFFTDTKTGLHFRHIYSDKEVLQLQVDGRWYEYKRFDSEFEEEFVIPDYLQTFHLFTHKGSAIFLDINSRTIAFEMDKYGNLTNSKEHTWVAYKSDVKMPEVDLFEPSHFRLHEMERGGKRRIRFPRFKTSSGSELRLIEKEKNLFVLQENQKFVLISPIQGILGVLENKLCFKHQDTGEIKVLVPIKKAHHVGSLAPVPRLALEDPKKWHPFASVSTYAEYSYSKGGILPKDVESKLFRSYLFLIQKKEKESLALLESIGSERSFTPEMKEILSWMADSPNKTPSGVAIALRAEMLLSRDNPNKTSITPLFEDYRDRYTSIPAQLRLSQQELKEAKNLCPFIQLPKSSEVTKTPVPSPYGSLVVQVKARYHPSEFDRLSDDYRKHYKNFKDLYDKLLTAPTLEGKGLILARIPLEDFLENEKALLLLVGSYQPGLFKIDPLNWLSSPAYLIPPSKKAIDNDIPLPKGTSLRSLQSVLEDISVPSYTEGTLPVREIPPIVDLQKDLVEPFFKEVAPVVKVKTKPLTLPDLSTSLYKKPLARAIREANEEIELGSKMNGEESSFSLRWGVSQRKVRESVEEKLTSLKLYLGKSKQDILFLARQLPKDSILAKKTVRLETGGYKKVPEFEEIITHYLKGTYEDLNPHLTKEQLEELDGRVQEFLLQATKAQQLERALEQTDPHLMAITLGAKMAYSLSKNKEERAFLVYEYRSGLRIRPQQETAIRAMLGEDEDLVLQLMMGGGKTTVLTSIFLQMIKSGKIPIYIPPDAQYDTQVNNLMNMQHKHFYKHVIPMRFSREDLTAERLLWMVDKFKEASSEGKAIVATKNTLSSLELEFYSLLERLPSTLSLKEESKIPLLRKLLLALKSNGVVLLDEVDDLLDPFKQLNFPVGDKKPLDSDCINFTKEVFALHLSPEIEQTLGLTRGDQNLFSKEKYKEQIVPLIGEGLFEKYKDVFRLPEPLKKACIEYIVSGKADPSFQALLEKRSQSKDPEIERSAKLIYLAKGLLHDYLPSLMEKQENRNYGIPDGAKDRKVVPFEGARSPSYTEFAGPYEAACYHDFTALSNLLSEDQLQKMASNFLEKAIPLVQYTKQKLADTPEGIKFFQLTGVPLERFQRRDPEALQKALSYLSTHPESRLEIEKIFIEEFVGAYESYFQSNSQHFLDLFSRRVGITGTPENPMLFPRSMPIYAEKGTLGRIRSTYLDRADVKTSNIHIAKTNRVEEVLASSLQNNPRKNRFRALLDPIGLFKDEGNRSIAEGVLTYFEQDPNIQSVLFYGRAEGNMGVAGTLMILKKPRKADGTFSCEKIEGTGSEALKEINPKTTFTFYDERHCEATDIPQIPDALGLLTVNSHLGDRDFLQTELRLRGYLGCQDIDLVILEKERKNYPANLTGRNVLTQMEIAQEIKSADEASTIFRQKMDNILRQRAKDLLLANPSHNLMKRVQDVLLTKQDLSPKAFFGGVSRLEDPLKLFDLRRKELEKQFPDLMDQQAREKFDSLRLELVENIDRFPELVSTSEATAQGMQMEVSIKQEIKQEVTVQVSLELQTEYQSYNQGFTGYPFEEIPWNRADSEIAVGERISGKPKIMTMYDLLQDIRYQKDYHELFVDSELLLTENFAYTKTWLLPIFSKRQKPAEQILIREEAGECKVLLLSEEEAFFFKDKIRNGLKNTWLYLPNGEMHVMPKTKALPKNIQKLQKALFDVNLINGNAGYLLLHKEETLAKVKDNPRRKDLLLRFLGVKVQGNTAQQGALDRLTLELNKNT